MSNNVLPFTPRKRTVVSNPQKPERSAPTPAAASVRLTKEEVFALSSWKAPEELDVDDHDCLYLEPAEESEWTRFFRFFGLQFPVVADSDTAYEIWRELTLTYAQPARLAAEGRAEDIPGACPELSADQRAYAIAVGRQETALAQRLAKTIFFGRQRSAFWAQ